MEKRPVTPSAISVQTKKKKPPLDVAMRLATPTPFPFMCRTGTPNARSDPRRMMTYPDRRPASTSIPYSQTTEMSTLHDEVIESARLESADDVVSQVKRKEEDREQRRDG